MKEPGQLKAGAVLGDDFAKRIGIVAALTLCLLALDRLPSYLPKYSLGARSIGRVVREMHNADLNAEDLHVLTAGYYEELRTDVPVAGIVEKDDVRNSRGFLRYELKPNLKRRYAAGMRITNSLAMPNPEYGLEKPPHTRRIALLGASLSIGPYGHDYPALLEERLNRDCRTPEVQAFQVLNFSVYGYSVLQEMDVALEKVSKFHPDVYLVAVASLEVYDGSGWKNHVGRLVLERADLKYDYLRNVVAQAGVRPTDRLAIINAKLEPFLIPVVRWSIERIRDHARAEGADMVIHLVPSPTSVDFTAADFDRLHPALDNLGVPVLDLRDTFRGANLDALRVVSKENARDDLPVDIHPNVRGNEMIFQNLYAGLRTNPAAWSAVAGSGCAILRQ